jgi:hypothetical protein
MLNDYNPLHLFLLNVTGIIRSFIQPWTSLPRMIPLSCIEANHTLLGPRPYIFVVHVTKAPPGVRRTTRIAITTPARGETPVRPLWGDVVRWGLSGLTYFNGNRQWGATRPGLLHIHPDYEDPVPAYTRNTRFMFTHVAVMKVEAERTAREGNVATLCDQLDAVGFNEGDDTPRVDGVEYVPVDGVAPDAWHLRPWADEMGLFLSMAPQSGVHLITLIPREAPGEWVCDPTNAIDLQFGSFVLV